MQPDLDVQLLEQVGSWRAVVNSARTTVRKEAKDEVNPSTSWKTRMLLAEHSPIRQLSFRVIMQNLKSWVSVHLVRHKYGIEHFVSTQRSDRTGVPRDDLPQGALVSHEVLANAQAIINISRKRLCHSASPETQHAWKRVVNAVGSVCPELAFACVPDCVYRGWCFEYPKSCGFYKTQEYKDWVTRYREPTGGSE